MPTKCYYEVLGVSRDANDEDIKKGYRKLALQWHPDKNPDRIAEATEQFRLVQQAYDVLSDPQERTWYDDHREAIIRGGFKHRGADGSEMEDDNSLDVYEYFTISCFSGFDDGEKGFFSVYGKVFKQISQEDLPFLEESEQTSIPEFGLSDSSYDDVVGQFYDYWESYTTARSFCWVDKWDTRDAPNRNVRRIMDAENKKLRDQARKERNEEVRALVRFVRKRDPRVAVRRREIEERNAAAAKKQAEQRRQEAIARREMRAAVVKEANEGKQDWTHTDDASYAELEEKLAAEFGRHSISDNADVANGEDEEDPLYCVACDKSFKTEKALVNHIRSRKHVDRVQFVRSQLGEADDNEEDEMATQILKRLDFLDAKAAAYDADSDGNEDGGKAGASNDSTKKKSSKKKKGKQSSSEEDVSGNEAEATEKRTDNPPVSPPVDEPQKKPKVKTRPASSTVKSQPAEPVEEVCECQRCKEVFPSRNKLFQHLSSTGHAQPPKVVAPPPKSSKSTTDKKSKSAKAK